MRYKILFFTLLFISCQSTDNDLSHSKPGRKYYSELINPHAANDKDWTNLKEEINVGFGDSNIRYPKEQVPQASLTDWTSTAWKGERIHTQILVWTKKKIAGLTVIAGDLVNDNGNKISSSNMRTGFVRYVMTDEFGEGCDKRTPEKYDSSLVEDPIDIIDRIDVMPFTVQPVWLTVHVPGDIHAGIYRGSVKVNAGEEFTLSYAVNVTENTLPPASEWKFDLDLWQNPDPVAKVHGVELWSDEHYSLMRPYYEMLAGAGQKSITAFIIDQPWGPDHVYYRDPAFINWSRKKDGSWSYDYSVFDKYVEFVMSCGIDQRINCYSMITWDLRFIYFDESRGDTVSVYAKPGSQAYYDIWNPMISDFTRHLKEKGWFDKTTIAMDERNMESMLEVIALIRKIDPGWKLTLAGGYHREIAMDIYDYCVIIGRKFDSDILEARKKSGMPSTYYTACGERKPNCFTFSPPAEIVWIGWYAASAGYTGYLRWAYNNWTKDVLHDTRYKTWPAGDCYQIYPGPRTSVRFEKLIEGIQDFEKIRLMKEKFSQEGNEAKLKELDEALSSFTLAGLDTIPAVEMVVKAKSLLNNIR